MKNWEFDKETPQNFCLERETIAERQGSSEGQNSEEKPTQSKTNFSFCLSIFREKEKAHVEESSRCRQEESKETINSSPENESSMKMSLVV